MSNMAITIQTKGNLEEICTQISEVIKPAGFGVMTRINFHEKMKEKLNKDIKPSVVLGACNPSLVYSAYQKSKEVLMLIPCNIVVTEFEPHQLRIEAIRPTYMLGYIKDDALLVEAKKAESELEKCLTRLTR